MRVLKNNMNLQEKLKIIQQVSGLTQTEIATRLGVSFVAFNNWWTGKSQPHKNRLVIIDNLYRELTGQSIIPVDVLSAQKKLIEKEAGNYPNIQTFITNNPDIYNQFLLSLTYHSNKIEGSTLSEGETADIMFHNQAIPHKSLIEQLEVKNHQTALQYLFHSCSSKQPITKDLILRLHEILMNGIRDDAGFFRNHGVRIVGANVPTANYLKIPSLIDDLIRELNKDTRDIVALVSRVHAQFEQIHPFADGNGRIGRLIMTGMLLGANIAPAVIRQERKQQYYTYLNKAQTQEELSQLEYFICEAILAGFVILKRM